MYQTPQSSGDPWTVAASSGGGRHWWKRHFIAVVAAAAAIVTAIAVTTLVLTRSDADLDSLLPDHKQVAAIMGEKDMVTFAQFDRFPEEQSTVSPDNCHALVVSAGQREYAPTKWTAMREVELAGYGHALPGSEGIVDQAVFRVPSADLAHDFLRATAAAFNTCLNTLVTRVPKLEGETEHIVYRDFVQKENALSVMNSAEEVGTCQRAVAVASNYIADVRACGEKVTGEAETIAQKILAKAQDDG
jgi:hypothetical protein